MVTLCLFPPPASPTNGAFCDLQPQPSLSWENSRTGLCSTPASQAYGRLLSWARGVWSRERLGLGALSTHSGLGRQQFSNQEKTGLWQGTGACSRGTPSCAARQGSRDGRPLLKSRKPRQDAQHRVQACPHSLLGMCSDLTSQCLSLLFCKNEKNNTTCLVECCGQ